LKAFVQQIADLASPGQNFAALRDHMESLSMSEISLILSLLFLTSLESNLDAPLIPYLGLFQKDIIYVKEREPQAKQEEMILKFISEFQKFYAAPSNIVPNPFRQVMVLVNEILV
jgi:hypothetical protein